MTDYISFIGLVLIAFGWALQFLSMKNGKKEIKKEFVIVNCIGILLLIVNAYLSGIYEIAVGNILTFLGSIAVLSKIK